MVQGDKNVIATTLMGAKVLKMTKTAKTTQNGTIPEKKNEEPSAADLIYNWLGLAGTVQY